MLLLGAFGFTASDLYNTRSMTLDGHYLEVLEPKPSKGVVLVVHSVFQDQETALPIARALYSAGFTAVAVKLQPGHSFQDYQDTLKGICDTFQDHGPIFAVGHSMGADLVTSLAADDPRIRSLVALGFPVETGLLDCSVLVAAGAWDQVHSRSSLQAAAGDNPFIVSPFSDHSQETLDPYLWRMIAENFGGRLPTRVQPHRILSQGLLVLGLAGLVLSFRPWSLEQGRKAALVLFLLVAVLGICYKFAPYPWIHPTMLGLWLGVSLANGVRGCTSMATHSLLRWGAIGVICVGISWLLNCYQNVIAQPSVVLGLPVALLSWFPILAARLVNALFSQVPGSSGVGPFFVGLLLLEVAFPGRLFGAILGGLRTLASKFRKLKFESGSRPRWAHVLLLLLLGAVAATLWRNVGQAGYVLEWGDFLRLGGKFFFLLVVPILLMVLAVRKWK